MKQHVQPIQKKINRAILLTSTAVLLLTGLTYLTYEFFTIRESAVDRMSVLGEVIANNSTAAMAFDSREEGNEILSALKAQEHIVAAALYDEAGQLFSKYPVDLEDENFPPGVNTDGHFFVENYLHGFHPVILGDNRIGTLYLKYNMRMLSKQLHFFGFVGLGAFLVSLLLVYVLSSQLQKRISKPIVALADIARSISERKDYSVRGIKQSSDEIGLLTEAFNQMLAQIEQQNLALQDSEKRFRALADNIAQLAWIADETGWVTWYNKRWYDYTGCTAEELEGWGWHKIHHPDYIEQMVHKFNQALKEGTVWEDTFPLRGRDGTYRWFLLRAVPILDERGAILQWFGTNTDISELRKTEEALRLSEEFNRTLLDSSPECVQALDLEGRLLSMNPPGQRMFEIDDFNQYRDHLWFDLWMEEIRNEAFTAVEVARNGEIGHFQGFSPTLKGTSKCWDVLVAPVRGADGKVERLVAVSRDITQLKELEQQKDDFIGIASHELKTPVTSIKAYTQILQKRFQKHEDALSVEMLSKMDLQLDKLTKLITDLLDVTKIEQGSLQFQEDVFDFNELVNDVVEEVQRTSTKHRVIQELAESRRIRGDRDRIGQVVTNFLTNAIKYSPKADQVILRSETKDECKLIFSVQDFGLGLNEQDRVKVFERFYRVGGPGYETYPGLGLGLFISAGIIQRHNGEIWVDSKKGNGSTFYFSLPVVNE